jgi:carbamoyltransferase
MIILGISGFEDAVQMGKRHIYTSRSQDIEDLFGFSEFGVPLQYFPLHLIGHDSSAALICDGKVVAFASEERFSRVKHGFNLAGRTVMPRKAIAYCLEEAGITWADVDFIAHYCCFTEDSIWRRFENIRRELNSGYQNMIEREYKEAYGNKLAKNVVHRQIETIAGYDIADDRLISVKHHLAHAAGAYFSSEFEESLILTLDGYGEEESSIWGIGQGDKIFPKGSIQLPTSLGLLYQVITSFLGFRSFGDEYKVMGLSSYGNPETYHSVFEQLIQKSYDGRYSIHGLSRPDLLLWLEEIFGHVSLDNEFSQKKADIAASLQKALESTILDQMSALKDEYHATNLCLSGGVGLNACANGAILRSGLFENIFIQPASGDDGTSLGAALFVLHEILDHKKRTPVEHVYLGPVYGNSQIEADLQAFPQIVWNKIESIEDSAAQALDEGKIVGWFQGRMEMGPRALGARSILADPRRLQLRDEINAKIKNRESFRPFAPSVLAEEAARFFGVSQNTKSPFMLMTFNTHDKKRKLIPAVVHVDGSSRIQTVSQEDNPRYYQLLRKFYTKTGIPLLLNTSFNRAGEPIVNSPAEAVKCFLRCGMDVLFIEDYMILPRGDRS